MHHNSFQNHEMIFFWKFLLNASIFEQDTKHKEEDHSVMSLATSLTCDNFCTNFFSQTVFAGWKTPKLYILAENEKNPLSRFRENFKYLMFDYFFLILRTLRFFWNIVFKSFLVPSCPLNLCKKSDKSLEMILRKRCY